jgi:6-phosphofructokinase 1
MGYQATRLLMEERYGHLVGLRGTEIVPYPIKDIAGRQRCVEPGSPLIEAARAVGTCFGADCSDCTIRKRCDEGSY